MTNKFLLCAFLIFMLFGCNDTDGTKSNIGSQNIKDAVNQRQPLHTPSAQAQKKIIKVVVRNASYPIDDPGGNDLSRYYELRERTLDLPLNQTALILIDTWDRERGRFKKSSAIDDMVKNIRLLLKMARRHNMLVLYAPHRPVGWDGINHKARNIDLRGPTDTPRTNLPKWVQEKNIPDTHWPPVDFIFRVGEYSKYTGYTNPSYIPYPKILGIHRDLLPQKRKKEFISNSLKDTQKIFREHKILHLLYVGAATNQCVIQRPGGYNTIIVRGATVGSELQSTRDSQRVTKAAILDVEINYGFSVDINDLLSALESI